MTDHTIQSMRADQILAVLETHRDELRAMGVTRLGLFGSCARNEQHAASDIDLLFEMDDFTWARWMDLWNYLEDELGVPVDLVPAKDLRDELRQSVMREVRYVAARPTASCVAESPRHCAPRTHPA